MGESAAELRQEIEQTRQNMTYTVDAIEDRVMPGRIIERRRNRMRSGMTSLRDRVMGAPHHLQATITDSGTTVGQDASQLAHRLETKTEGSPFAAGLMAFGAGMLAAALLPPSDTERQMADKIKDAAEPLKEPLSEAAHQLAEDAKTHSSDAVDAVKAAGNTASEQITTTAKDKANETKDQVRASGQART
jgi:ElaB/YqjD/DUF883 family membrane-anchored ribosome-binding protein